VTTRAELEAAIVAAPLDRGPRMVYGDWLQAQGDVRGEWVAMLAAIEAAPHDTRLRLSALEFLATHRRELLGNIDDVMAGTYLGWRGGFVDEIRLQPVYGRHASNIAWHQPTFRFVRHVALGALIGIYNLLQEVVRAKLPLLDSIVVFDTNTNPTLVLVNPLAEIPTLRSATLHRASITVPLPQLRELTVVVDPSHTELIDWLARGSCAGLEALTLLYLEGGGHPARIVDVVRACPQLRELRVIGAAGASQLAEMLGHLTTKLRVVDFSHSDLNDAGHAALRSWQPRPEIFAWCTNVSPRVAKQHRASRPMCGVYEIMPATPMSYLVHRFTTGGRDALRMLPSVGLPLYNLGTHIVLEGDHRARDAMPYLDASATLPAANHYSLQLANAAIAHERANELAEAELRAREALPYFPLEPNFHAIFIDALRRTGRLDEAVASIPAALRAIETPDGPGAHTGAPAAALHDCLLALGRIGRYRELVDLSERRKCAHRVNADSRAALVIAQLALGNRAAAELALVAANAGCTKPIIHHARAAMFAAEGKLAQARAAVIKARDEGYTEMPWIEADPVLGAFIHAKPKPKPKPAPKPAPKHESAKPKKKRSGKKPNKQRRRAT
jgi:uncharacterized protein (TIGR02996 family)